MQKNIFDIKTSFGAKVTFWTIFTASLVMVISFFFVTFFASERMLREGHQKANLELEKAQFFVEDKIYDLEEAGESFTFHSAMKDELSTPDEVYDELEDFLRYHDYVHQVVLSFEKGLYPEFEYGFAPCVREVNGKIERFNLADKQKHSDFSWFKQAKKLDESNAAHPKEWEDGVWIDPYVDAQGDLICSYCIPQRDHQDRFFGVLALDISVDDIEYFADEIHPYPSSFISLLDHHHRVMVHPNSSYVNQYVGDLFKETDRDTKIEQLVQIMKQDGRGMSDFDMDDGEKVFDYFTTLSHTGWTIVLECKASEIQKDMKEVMWSFIVVAVLGLLLLYVAIALLMRKMVKPVRQFSDAALQMAEGDLNTLLPEIKDKNELWTLGESLDHMQHSLADYIEKLKVTEQAKGRIESELQIANKIQMAMLPKTFPPFPERKDLDIFGMLTPARQVGGDLYDFFIRDEKLFFCIGDVSGKGVPAALFMAVSRSLVRVMANHEDHPAVMVKSMNDTIDKMNEQGMFVTLFVGVHDLQTGLLTFCNAGHDAPVIIDCKGHAQMMEVDPNLPVGIMTGMSFSEQSIQLESGSTIFLYTDGVTEAMNEAKELYGEKRMLACLNEMQPHSVEDMLRLVEEDVKRHVDGCEQSDDLTMLGVGIKV